MVCLLGGTLACGDDGSSSEVGGDMNPPQESVSDGTQNLTAKVEVSFQGAPPVFGLTGDQVADGWTLEYTKLLVTVGTVTIAAPGAATEEAEVDAVIDLLQASTALRVATVDKLPAGALTASFTLPDAHDGFTALAGVADEDRARLADNGWSVYVEGTISKPDGYTCVGDDPPLCTLAPTIRFAWGAAAGALFEDCPTITLDEGEVVQRIFTLPGDRWLRTDFQVAGAAPPVLRAQWIADADTNRDGEATMDELTAIVARKVLGPRQGYDIRNGAPIPVETLHDFFAAQAMMIGREALGCATIQPL